MIDGKTIEKARGADIVSFLERRVGFAFDSRGGSYRCRQHPSLAVKCDRLSWYWHSKRVGGFNAIDYLVKVERMPFREAVMAAAGSVPAPARPHIEARRPKSPALPEKAGAQMRLYEYLCEKRGIDSWIVKELIQKKKLYVDKRGNCVFVGHDENGAPRFASLRGTYGDRAFRMDCAGSDKRYAFQMESACSNRLYVFESAIDAMSWASLENILRNDRGAWKRHNCLSLAGISDAPLPMFLSRRPEIKGMVFCLDNDEGGKKAAAAMAKKYAAEGFHVSVEAPFGKDYNVDLLTYRNKPKLWNPANPQRRNECK